MRHVEGMNKTTHEYSDICFVCFLVLSSGLPEEAICRRYGWKRG